MTDVPEASAYLPRSLTLEKEKDAEMKKKMLERLLALTIALTLILSLAACGQPAADNSQPPANNTSSGGEQSDAPEQGGGPSGGGGGQISNLLPEVSSPYGHSAKVKHESIIFVAAGDPGNLLPQDLHTSGKELLDSIFERLYIIDGFGGDLLPLIAEDMPTDNGDGTYDIKIRENIYDSDGNHLTASDVAFSYTWLVENSTPHNMGKFHSAEAVSDYVVRFHCDTLDGVSDLGNLFAQQLIFTEKAFNDHDFATDAVGTGPYKVTSFTPGSTLVLDARDDYWCEGEDYQLSRYRANVQTVTYKIMSEASQQANAMRTGELDYSNTLSETDLPDFLNDGQYASGFNAFPFLENLTYYLIPNCDPSSPCSDLNLRKAIMYAVDGATCAVASGNSSAQTVYDMYNAKFPETRESWSTTEDTFYTNPSLETAKEYLDQSGYNNEEIKLVTTEAPPAAQNVATVVAQLLQSIGINCKLNVITGAVYNEVCGDPAQYDIIINMMAADDYGVVVYSRLMGADSYGGGQETINFIKDAELQRLITECNSAAGHTDENTQALHDYVIENAYGRGLFVTTSYNVCRSTIKEVAMSFKFLPMPGGCVYEDNEF